jgi:hypothetical protein
MWEFIGERVEMEPWDEGEVPADDVGLEAAKGPVRVGGPGEGARGNREVPPTDSAAEGR